VKRLLLLLPAVTVYILLMPHLAHFLHTEQQRVAIEFPPPHRVLKAVSLDHSLLVGEMMIYKVITFYGGQSTPGLKKMTTGDFFVMYKNVDVATSLDPYNFDAYYFTQAAFTWEVQQYAGVNQLLEYGMKYRYWDYYLPFFVAFNYSYFLKDPASAAKYYRKAAEITGNDLFMRLASRNYYESGHTSEAIVYLSVMIDSSKNEALRQMLKKRLAAFKMVRKIELARDRYQKLTGTVPGSVEQLFSSGYLDALPVDPYGGKFYLDDKGMVRSSSNFSNAPASHKVKSNSK